MKAGRRDDRVHLVDLEFTGHHGVFAEERERGQRFVVDVTLVLDLEPAGRSDELAKTVNYELVAQEVRAVVEGPARSLLEAVAEAVAERLLKAFPVRQVQVTVKKPEAPLEGRFGWVGVEITRP